MVLHLTHSDRAITCELFFAVRKCLESSSRSLAEVVPWKGAVLSVYRVQYTKSTIYNVLSNALDTFSKEATKLLHEVSADVERVGMGLEGSCLVCRDELLAATMAFACDGLEDLVKFSHVNRRFRIIAMGMVDVWGSITPFLHPDCVAACLSRNKSCPLRVQILPVTPKRNAHQLENGLQPYLDTILPTAHRWKSLAYESAPLPGYVESLAFKILKGVLHRTRPSGSRTTSVYLLGGVLSLLTTVLLGTAFQGGTFTRRGETPKLREITFRNIVPRAFTCCSITSFTMEIPKREVFGPAPLHPTNSRNYTRFCGGHRPSKYCIFLLALLFSAFDGSPI